MEKEPLEVVRLKSLEDLTGGRIADTSSVPTKALPGRLWHPILQKEASRKYGFNLGCFVKICVFLKTAFKCVPEMRSTSDEVPGGNVSHDFVFAAARVAKCQNIFCNSDSCLLKTKQQQAAA